MAHFSIHTRSNIHHFVFGLILSILTSLISCNPYIGMLCVFVTITYSEIKHVEYKSYVPLKISNIFKYNWRVFNIINWIYTMIGSVIGSIIILLFFMVL